MKILIVVATKLEIAPLLKQVQTVRVHENTRLICGFYKEHEINFLITGAGMVATTYFTGKVLNENYDLALNVGICGSFNTNLEIGSVVNIYEDCLAEMGAENDTGFLSMQDLKLEAVTKINNINQGVLNHVIELLPKVNGITVNKVHGNESTIRETVDRYHPIVESMEGAAFMFVCDQERIPFLQIRAVSNIVEKRNRDRWNIPLAVENLNKKLIELLDNMSFSS